MLLVTCNYVIEPGIDEPGIDEGTCLLHALLSCQPHAAARM
jgi:hypothetical protein